MTDEKIIKANHCCVNDESCVDCPYFVDVDNSDCKQMRIDTLDLLHRYKAENERLKANQKNEIIPVSLEQVFLNDSNK